MSTSPTRRKGKYLPSLPTHQIFIVDPTQTPLQCWLIGRNPPQKRNLLLATPWDKNLTIKTMKLSIWRLKSPVVTPAACCLTPESPRLGQDLQYLAYLDQTSQDFYLADLNLRWTCFLVGMEGEWKYWTALHCSEKGTYCRDQVPIGTFFRSLLIFQGPYFLHGIAFCILFWFMQIQSAYKLLLLTNGQWPLICL